MNVTLRDIKPQAGKIPGGVLNLYIAKVEDVTGITVTPNATTGEDEVTAMTVTGEGFKKFEFEPGTCKLSHPSVGEDGSGSFESLLDWVIAGDDDRLGLFNKMINGRYIMIADMASNRMRVAGSLRAPMLLRQVNYDSGADQPERNGTTFQAKGRGGDISPAFVGEIPSVV